MSDERSAAAEIAQDCSSFALRAVHRVLTRHYEHALAPHDITISGLNLLVTLEQYEGATGEPVRPSALQRHLQIEQSTLSRELVRLERAGFVDKIALDGRSRGYRVTQAARDKIDEVLPAWRQAQAEVLELLGASTHEALEGVHRRLRSEDQG